MNTEERLDPDAIELTLRPITNRDDIATVCDRLTFLHRAEGPTTVICDVGQIKDPTMVTVEALTQLRLTARRLGLRLWLYRSDKSLRSLLELLGLSSLLPERLG